MLDRAEERVHDSGIEVVELWQSDFREADLPVEIGSFRNEPSINSSLKFLGNTDSARAKVERLYLDSVSYDERHRKDNTDHRSGSC